MLSTDPVNDRKPCVLKRACGEFEIHSIEVRGKEKWGISGYGHKERLFLLSPQEYEQLRRELDGS